MIDLVKKTLINRIKSLDLKNITVLDGSNEKVFRISFPKALFKKRESEISISIIDYDEYTIYGNETIVDFVGDVSGFELQVDGKNTGCVVSSYDPINGIIVVDKEIDAQMFKYDTIISFAKTSSTEESKNRIEVSGISTFVVAKNRNISYKRRRYDILLFVHDDANGDLTSYYVDSIQSVLKRDFPLLGENGESTKSIVYVSDDCRFDIVQYNKTNRVMRGTILLQTIIN